MAVIKLTASKKAVQFIDDDGNVFQTSVVWLANLLQDNNSAGLVLLTRMPWKVSEDRFKKSPLYGNVAGPERGAVEVNEDSLSLKSRSQREQAVVYNQKVVLE